MDNEKNLLLAIALSIGVYVLWFTFISPPPKPVPPSAGQKARDAASLQPGAPSAAQSNSKPATVNFETLQPLKIPSAEIKISPAGAALASYQYQGPLGLVELVPPDSAPGFFATWPDEKFQQVPGGDKYSVRYHAKHPLGFEIDKTYSFGATGELSRLRITFSNPGSRPIDVPSWDTNVGPGIFTVKSEKDENPRVWRAIGLFPPPPNHTQPALETLKPGDHEGDFKWLAVDNRYFIAAVVADPKQFPRFNVDNAPFKMAIAGKFDKILGRAPEIKDVPAPAVHLRSTPLKLEPNSLVKYDIPFYLGPKNFEQLKSLDVGLERAVNFGWFDSLGRMILRVLEYLHERTGNYGWSIILLTCLIQIILFPLTFKSLKATVAMKKIQPELAKIQQKFKDNPQRLQAEMMELYRARGVNPMGGCLPMIVQMPVFVALFNTLRGAWELHGAPWIFWIHDLSARDPYYILPVFMGGVMFFQNKLNPAVSADPAQAQMMQWMPIVFTFMFMNFPVGVVLYWLTNSLLSVAQQTMLRKQLS